MDENLVAGRACGPCTACCVALTIDEPALQKLSGYACEHLSGAGCAVYAARPGTCERFYCGWRRLKWIPLGLRPDVSGVLVRLVDMPANEPAVAGDAGGGLTVAFTFLRRAALRAEGLAEAVAASIQARMPTHTHLAGPPGHTATRTRLNEVLAEAVRRKDKGAILRRLEILHRQNLSAPHRPVVLTSHTGTVSAGVPAAPEI